MQVVSPTELSRSRHHRRRQFWTHAKRALAASLLLARTAGASFAPPPAKPSDFDAKAAQLLNLGKFVRLSRQGPTRTAFDICTVGHDAMASSLEGIASGARINNLPVRITPLKDISGAKSCAIVFLSAAENARVREDLAILGSADILTVSDAPDFLEHGGMIQFVPVSGHVRFAVNLNAVNRTHLVLSSELLRVASSVSGRPPTGDLP